VPEGRHEAISKMGTQKYYTLPYRAADKSLARQGRKQATATEDIDFHISHLYS